LRGQGTLLVEDRKGNVTAIPITPETPMVAFNDRLPHSFRLRQGSKVCQALIFYRTKQKA
jgi:hypothetical protein